MAGEEMAALAALQKQMADLKNSVFYLTEKMSAGAGAGVAATPAEAGDVVAALEAVSKELKALGDQVGYVSRISSDGFSSIKGVTDKIAAVPTPQKMDAMAVELGAKIEAVAKAAQSGQGTAELSKKVDAVAENLGYVARQSSDLAKRLGESSAKLDDSDAKLNTLLQRMDKVAVDTQSKQMDLLTETLSLMNKELNSAKASYADLQRRFEAMPTAQQLEKLAASITRMAEAQAVQEKRFVTVVDALSMASKQMAEDRTAKAVAPVNEQLNRLSIQLVKLSEAEETQRRQGEIAASALATLVKEVGAIGKAMPKYEDIEKRMMSHLAEKMAGSQ